MKPAVCSSTTYHLLCLRFGASAHVTLYHSTDTRVARWVECTHVHSQNISWRSTLSGNTPQRWYFKPTSNLLQPRRFQLRAIMQLRERNEILLPRPSTQTSAPRPIELDGVQYLTTEEPGHGSILFAPLLGRWEHRPARSRRTVAPAPRPRRRRIVPPICPRVRPQPRARTRRAASAVPECPPLLESGTGWFVLPRGPFISCVVPIPPSCG